MKGHVYEESWYHLTVFTLEMCNAIRVKGQINELVMSSEDIPEQ